ncbi:E3 ubiquitin-protein ligase CCNB1IP1-like [Mya arenaria]|uniref:E3 ubiquitin-protein ligase CCNB1IP1-like n=1 Tax=Mya arenaria TaxID=6604 RepID=UPI0022E81220|nr:E3 ubiquitin-protein ligase CCNB1IP1-like [Mya arenaria]
MEGDDLICNYRKCRKRLTDIAYVTACSHVFCDEDGTREFNKSKVCPACQTNLSLKFEIVRNNLQPSEQYKSMILAGLKPDVINEICSRAIAFWMYQSHQEKTYQEYMGNKARERATQLEQYYEQLVSKTSTELNSLKTQIGACKKELDDTKKKYSEVTDKLMEKNRQHQKLQSMYDSLRRKYISMSAFDPADQDPPNHAFNNAQGAAAAADNRIHRSNIAPVDNHFKSPSGTVGFDFRPQTGTTNYPANRQDNRQGSFNIDLGTPRK